MAENFKVTKAIDFCYGHRLRDYDGKCKNVHGHNGRAEFDLTSAKLDKRSMVVDFSDIADAMRNWINNNLDHAMLMRKDDPMLPIFKKNKQPCYVMDNNPTAESIAKLLFDKASEHGFPVAEVRMWETPTSFATYRKQ
ncbi:MAG: 6-carboxytetrahydropterin synthase [Dehalococcoidia bacterium]|nr:6-carboxytetrahydropterin synthase [Dehalococcoidia bacterium]